MGGSLAVCPGHAVRPGHVPELAGWPSQPLSCILLDERRQVGGHLCKTAYSPLSTCDM